MALDLLGSCACSVDACGGPGTACAPRAMGAALSGVTAQHASTRPNGRNDLMNFATRLATLERQQILIQARQDLWQTIARYARGIDEQRDDDLADLLTDDMVLQTEPWTQRPLVGKALALKALRNYRRAFQCPRHFITNHQLSINDDSTATGYANWLVVQSREGQSYCGWGSYEWDFRCAGG